MAPNSRSYTPVHKEALQAGFNEHNWDPHETEGKKIKAIIKGTRELFDVLRPLFSTSDGGTKKNNNAIYTHYKTQASEYITAQATLGVRRSDSKHTKNQSSCIVLCFCRFLGSHIFLWSSLSCFKIIHHQTYSSRNRGLQEAASVLETTRSTKRTTTTTTNKKKLISVPKTRRTTR